MIRFAIVGCGRISKRHSDNIRKYGVLVAACDERPERTAELVKGTNARTYAALSDMLEREKGNIDVLSVCTPNGLHAQHSIEGLKAGCHVMCEKPMATTPADCATMIKTAERANRRLFIVKQNRFNPPVVGVKELIDSGTLGRIFSAHLNCFWNRDAAYYQDDWKGSLSLDGGTLYTQYSHFLDLILWFCGDVAQVHAYTDNFGHKGIVEYEDEGVAILRFRSGTLGTVSFSINTHAKNMEGSLTLICEYGTVKIGGQYLNELEYQNIKDTVIADLPQGGPANEYGHYQGSMSNHEDVYKNVVDVLTTGGTMTTVGYEGLETVELICRMYKSAKNSSEA